MPLAIAALFGTDALAGSLPQHRTGPGSIQQASPTLAPFQHVRFCLRYPAECRSDQGGAERIDLDDAKLDLLKRINQDVNASISPSPKSYGAEVQDSWTIAPVRGDCNDYAVTKRHELIARGWPARALRLSVVRTGSGVGHLVLVVATGDGDLVLDNLTETIRSWQDTGYRWLKIQSASDARFWYEIKTTTASADDNRVRVAGR